MSELKYHLIGDDMQAVVIDMAQGQVIRAEAGAMMYMTEGIEMDAKLDGGFLGGLKRKVLAGESFFITHFHCSAPAGQVAFSAPYPGKILARHMANETLLCQKDAYLCSSGEIDINVAFTKRLGAGFFGGEGFILQKLQGSGDVFIHAGGTLTEIELAAGQRLKVDTGCLVAFDQSVDYDIKMVGGIKTSLFGGEGLFFAHLTGPGTVYLQTLPFSRLADRITAAAGSSKGEHRRGRGVSGMLGDIIGGD